MDEMEAVTTTPFTRNFLTFIAFPHCIQRVAKTPVDSTSKQLRGFALVRQIYDELYTELSEEFSAAELLRAAQMLIETAREEYGDSSFQDGHLHPGYYSFPVDRMIGKQDWWILGVEAMALDQFDDYTSPRSQSLAKLREFYNPEPYDHRQ